MSTEAAGAESGEMSKMPTRSNDEEDFFMATKTKGSGPGGPGGGLLCPRKCGNSFHDPHVLAGHVASQHVTHSTATTITDGRRKK